ncbi:MAG: hypothetical protein M3Z16_04825, partial [Pseudomonadota bacterium]|nr:hypothetical protein [Pseudomonadota bacterium]
VKLHEAVPSAAPTVTASLPVSGVNPGKAKTGVRPAKRQGLDIFATSRVFTDTAYDELVASTDMVKVEAAPIKGR